MHVSEESGTADPHKLAPALPQGAQTQVKAMPAPPRPPQGPPPVVNLHMQQRSWMDASTQTERQVHDQAVQVVVVDAEDSISL